MKALRQIIIMAAATLAMASCDDDSMNLDKTQIYDNGTYGLVTVSSVDGRFQLGWSQPVMSTQNGGQVIAGDNNALSYDVYVVAANKSAAMGKIKTVDGCSVELSVVEVEAMLKKIDEYAMSFKFCVCMAGTNVPVCYSVLQWVGNINTMGVSFDDYFNRWFTDNKKIGEVKGNVAEIRNESNSSYWDKQFCNIFRGLPNQAEGKKFELSFDVKWKGDDTKDKSALFTVYTGKYMWNWEKEDIIYVYDYDDKQWDFNYNTQLVFDKDDFWMEKSYTATTSWETFTFGGKIGEMGAEIIGIEINLSGYNVNEMLNPNGTFYFKNMVVKINDKVVAEYYMEK